MSTETSITSALLRVLLQRFSYAPLPWNRWLARAITALTVVMAAYLGAAVWAKRGDLTRAFSQFPLAVLFESIGLVLLGLGLRAVRWQYYVARLGWNVPWRPSVSAFLASFAFTATPGKAGEVVKSVLLRTSHDVPLSDGVGVLLVERLGDLLAVLILAVGGLALLTDATVYFVGTAIVVAAATVFFSNRWIYYLVLRQFAKIKKLAGVVEKVLRALDTCRSLLRPIPFLLGVGIALVAWSCEGLAFHLIIRSFGLECGILESFSIYGIATLVGAAFRFARRIGKLRSCRGAALSPFGHVRGRRNNRRRHLSTVFALAGQPHRCAFHVRLDVRNGLELLSSRGR